MRRPASITLRLTVLFSLASLATLVAVGYLLTAAVKSHFLELDRVELNGKLELVRHAMSKVRTQTDLDAIPQLLDDALVGHPGLSILVFAPDRRILFASSDAVLRPAALERRSADGSPQASRLAAWENEGHSYRDIMATVPTGIDGAPPARVAIAVNIDHEIEFIAALREKLWLAVIAGAVLTIVLGWIAARWGLTPVERLTAVTRRISVQKMDERLPLASVPAELHDLAQSFNDMLARLQDSFRKLGEFSSDLAHEMRTPITNLMTQTEVALSRPRSSAEYREVLYSSLEELGRLARMTSDMLFLAKSADGMQLPRSERVDLAAETQNVFDFFAALAEERDVSLERAGSCSIVGERLMIRRAIGNLLSNAIRHTPRGGTVRVQVRHTDSGAIEFTVENPGSPIAPEHLPRLFDRFYRIDPARQEASEGAGLGLAITKSIIELHRACIVVTSSDDITQFKITFPPDQTPNGAVVATPKPRPGTIAYGQEHRPGADRV
jgi:two-component system, OmpR family, heavy metal sensor histidine kinase CusS